MKNNINYVIFGASGDLSKRYLLPAVEKLGLPVVKISRNDYATFNQKINQNSELIFHLAIPSDAVSETIKLISNYKNAKILLEKPFGRDLESAKNLVEVTEKYFNENQIYRVDHYLAKKSLQNLKIENPEKISSVEIIASEKIDIEGRVNFYEQTGALRDFVQNHMLEMAAVALVSFDPEARGRVLKNLAVVCDISKHECVKRGQYAGYREEVGNRESMTETFVAINLVYKNIPVVLKTGKALKEKRTEVKIHLRNGSLQIFNIEHEPDAYERVIEAAIAGNKDIFISKDEVLESWRILNDIQESWKDSTEIIIYPKGSEIDEI